MTPEMLNATEDSISAVHVGADGSSPEGWSRDLVLAKTAAMVALGLASFALGVLPLKLSTSLRLRDDGASCRKLVLSLLLCFGGGVLIFTTFVHLQPEVRLGFEQLVDQGLLPDTGHSVPLAELVFCAGFFFVYLVEELVHAVMDRRAHSGPEEGDEAVLHRTMSLRRCSRHQHDHGPPPGTIIPRVSLATHKGGDEALENVLSSGGSTGSSISASTQGLLNNSSSLSTILVTDASAPPPAKSSPLDAGAQMTGGRKPHRHSRGHNHHHHHHHYPSPSENDADPAKPRDQGTAATVAQSLRGLLAVLALSFHAVFEGLAVGLETNVTNVWYLFAAVASHKLVIAFCVGAELVTARTRRGLLLAYLATFAAVTPLGVGAGILLQGGGGGGGGGGAAAVVLQGMAGGTLMYVVFFEVLQRERANTQSGVAQLAAIAAGFLTMFGLQILIGHEHGEGHGHAHCHGHDHDADHHHDAATTLAAALASAATEAITGAPHVHR
ncbi:uncharacterized protein LOC134527929 [Bacillus rossius redtenbacheri]|uniref:uncharacterized protein LOC134527929 n=1 Tax=Bacillus rossius redtenbacheri TaxID=93214 RepID=UPI002FDCAA94